MINSQYTFENKKIKYQSPSLVILAVGKIVFKAAGTFPEKDGSTRQIKNNIIYQLKHNFFCNN